MSLKPPGVSETQAVPTAVSQSWASRARRFFFGDDVFISYARHDSDYALALADELTKHKLSCFLDQWGAPSGLELPGELVERLRKSTMLVVVGTERAAASENVRKEVLEFKKTGRPIIPITFVEEEEFARIRNNEIPDNLTGTLERSPWYGDIIGIARTVESKANLKAEGEDESADPSPQVITRIVNARGFISRSRRLRKTFWATLSALLAVLTIVGVVAWAVVAQANKQVLEANTQVERARGEQQAALAARNEANTARDLADAERRKADAARVEAEGKTRKASEDLQKAQGELKRINDTLIDANRKLRDEQAKVLLARGEAEKQQEIALTQRLANQSAQTLRQRPDLLISSVNLAVEAGRRAHDLGLRSLETDTALRDSLGLLPVSLGSKDLEESIRDFAFSPGGETFAALSAAQGSDDSKKTITIRRTADGGEVASLACDCYGFAVSAGGERVATHSPLTEGDFVRVRQTRGGPHWDIPVENSDDSVVGLALSPDGKYLLMALSNADAEMEFAELWDVENKTRVKQLDTNGYIDIKAVAFSPRGEYLAVAGAGYGPRGREVGRTLVWDVSRATDRRKLTEDDVRGPEAFLHDGEVGAVSIGDGGTYLATTVGRTALVWRRDNRGGFQQVARMPLEHEINALAFNERGESLLTLSGAQQNAEAARTPRMLETWGLSGYREVFTASHSDDIMRLAFAPADGFVTTVSDGYKEDKVRVWKANDGSEVKDASLLPQAVGEHVEDATEDARYVVTRAENVGWRVWDVRERRSLALPAGPGEEGLGQPVLRPDGQVAVRVRHKGGDKSSTVVVYRLEGGAYVRRGEWKIDRFAFSIAVSPSHDYLVVTGYQQPVELRRVGDGKDVTPEGLKVLKNVSSARLSPKGDLLALLAWEGKGRHRLLVWDVARGRALASLPSESEVTGYEFSPRGRYLAVADEAGSVRRLDLSAGGVVALQHDAPVKAVAFSADEQYLATGDDNGTLKVTETAKGEQVALLPHFGVIDKIAFSKDGKRVAVGTKAPDADRADEGEAHVLHVWVLNPSDLIGEACRRLKRFLPGGNYSPHCQGPA